MLYIITEGNDLGDDFGNELAVLGAPDVADSLKTSLLTHLQPHLIPSDATLLGSGGEGTKRVVESRIGMHAAKVPVEKLVEVSLPGHFPSAQPCLGRNETGSSLALHTPHRFCISGTLWHCFFLFGLTHFLSDVEFPAEIFCLPAPCWPLRLDANTGADSGTALTSGGKARMGDEEVTASHGREKGAPGVADSFCQLLGWLYMLPFAIDASLLMVKHALICADGPSCVLPNQVLFVSFVSESDATSVCKHIVLLLSCAFAFAELVQMLGNDALVCLRMFLLMATGSIWRGDGGGDGCGYVRAATPTQFVMPIYNDGLCVNSTQLSHVVSDQVGTLPTKTRPFWITGAGTRPQVCLPLPLDFTAVEYIRRFNAQQQPWNQLVGMVLCLQFVPCSHQSHSVLFTTHERQYGTFVFVAIPLYCSSCECTLMFDWTPSLVFGIATQLEAVMSMMANTGKLL
ncbi:hypothetical protein Pelo_17140 [Pelomyxa schiedti]|nr:hypothetical protein Pelo_17140 [Pelomyxa schiedti]